MKIIVDVNNSERQAAVVTIDTKDCYYPYALGESIE